MTPSTTSKSLHVCQLPYYVCSFVCMTSLKSRFNYSILRNFITSREIVKTTKKLRKKFFFHKINKNSKENQGSNILYIPGYDVTHDGFKAL